MRRNHRTHHRPARKRKPRNMQPAGWAIIVFMVVAVWLRMAAINPRFMEMFR